MPDASPTSVASRATTPPQVRDPWFDDAKLLVVLVIVTGGCSGGPLGPWSAPAVPAGWYGIAVLAVLFDPVGSLSHARRRRRGPGPTSG